MSLGPPPYPLGHGLLSGKRVLVTAAAGTGIGYATAKRCAEEGALVAISASAGLDPLIDANPDLDRATAEAQLKATLPVLQAKDGKPYGWMEPSEWEAFAQWMQRAGQLKNEAIGQRAFTNEFLPGQGV